MAGFENYAEDVREIEQELLRKGIALGIDWEDEAQVRSLAREALDPAKATAGLPANQPVDYRQMTRLDLYGLAGMMLKTMEESAGVGLESHGGPVWKAFAKALWAESRLADK